MEINASAYRTMNWMGRITLAIVSLASLLAIHGPAAAADKPEVYQLRPGDTVLVSVWREDALQREARVLPDGSITFPLVGRVDVGGLSTPEVEQQIASRLKAYFPEPIVSVVITGIEGNRAYVLGKVGQPGPIIMNGPTTVLQALSVAGGLDKFADEGAIKLVRTTAGRQEIMRVHYKDLISGRDMTPNVELKAGDTILVP
jgi:polysaccharide export outer membrane protein